MAAGLEYEILWTCLPELYDKSARGDDDDDEEDRQPEAQVGEEPRAAEDDVKPEDKVHSPKESQDQPDVKSEESQDTGSGNLAGNSDSQSDADGEKSASSQEEISDTTVAPTPTEDSKPSLYWANFNSMEEVKIFAGKEQKQTELLISQKVLIVFWLSAVKGPNVLKLAVCVHKLGINKKTMKISSCQCLTSLLDGWLWWKLVVLLKTINLIAVKSWIGSKRGRFL